MSDERLKQRRAKCMRKLLERRIAKSVRCVEISDEGEKEIPGEEKDGHRWVNGCTHSAARRRVIRVTIGPQNVDYPLPQWGDDGCIFGCRKHDLSAAEVRGLSVK